MKPLLKYTINQTLIILVAMLLLFLSYFPALYGPGMTSIAQILSAVLLGLLGLLNYLLTDKGLFLRRRLLLAFSIGSLFLLLPFLLDNILTKLDDYTFSRVSLAGIFVSGLIFVLYIFIIWRFYLRNK